MIKEAYCSLEVAKLLKEKGFDECIFEFYEGDKIKYARNGKGFRLSELGSSYYPHITHQMAMAWLREVHKVNIEIHYNRFGENYRYIIIYKPEVLDDIRSLGVFYHYEEAVEEALKYVLKNLI